MKNRYRGILGVLLLGSMVVSGCFYDNVEELYPNGCNLLDVSYSQNIVPILESNCLSCHNAMSEQGNVNLEGYQNVIVYVDNGELMGAIRHDDGYEPMPLTGAKLSNCQIDKFQAWIDQGAIDN